MKLSVEKINTVQQRLKVVISSEEVDSSFKEAYKKWQKKSKIQGFRQGKAPLYLIQKLYGSQVSYEVGDELIRKNIFEALKEKDVKPIAQPLVETSEMPKAGEDYPFSFVVDVMPAIDLAEKYKNLQIQCKKYKITSEDIGHELKNLAKNQARKTPLEGDTAVAQNGHLASVSYSTTCDGEPVAGLQGKESQVTLGENTLLTQIESLVVGMKVSETKEAEITLPEDFSAKDLANKVAKVTLNLHSLFELDIPAIDDELAKDLNCESLDALRAEIEKKLEVHGQDLNLRERETAVLNKLDETIDFEVPPAFIDQVIDNMISSMVPKKEERQKLAADKKIREVFQKEARKKAKNSMLMGEIIEKESLEVSEEEVKDYLAKQVSAGNPSEVEKAFQQYGSQVKEKLLFTKAVDKVISYGTLKEEEAKRVA